MSCPPQPLEKPNQVPQRTPKGTNRIPVTHQKVICYETQLKVTCQLRAPFGRQRARPRCRSKGARKQIAVAATKVHAAALSAIGMFSSPPLEFTKSKMSLWQPRKCVRRGGVGGGGERDPPPTTPPPSHTLSLQPQRLLFVCEFVRPRGKLKSYRQCRRRRFLLRHSDIC